MEDGKLWSRLCEGDLTMLNEKITRIRESSVAEGKKLFWIFAYLWVLLGLFSVHKSIVLNEPNLIYPYSSQLFRYSQTT
jgi:hypothetical protein